MIGCVLFGSVRSVRFGSVRFGSVWFRSVGFRSVGFRSVGFRSVGFARLCSVRRVRFGSVRFVWLLPPASAGARGYHQGHGGPVPSEEKTSFGGQGTGNSKNEKGDGLLSSPFVISICPGEISKLDYF